MTNHSTAAQTILDAAMDAYWKESHLGHGCVAAALRAAADQLTPYSVEDMSGAAFCRNKLLTLANELEGGK